MASEEPADPRFRELLEEFERHIRDNTDLDRLKMIRRQIRKALPLSVRAYLPAYLLREAVGAGVPRAASGRDRSAPTGRTAKAPAAQARAPAAQAKAPAAQAKAPAAQAKAPAAHARAPAAKQSSAAPASGTPRAPEPARRVPEAPASAAADASLAPTSAEPPAASAGDSDSDMARLFVSVGRSRRVSRQMLTDLFVVKLDLPQDQIGEVRVLDNFSFIEVPATIAQSAIDRITGETLNGRRVNVDYARSKKS
ncbi:MAG: DbpA RNA binding domain-containing protein [Spirochaetaceae bacterium]|nr:DbpA RNA binding domain-containing protein [Spirochaetaceae bacterium]